ncbi:ABC transporter substrate-binding protein [Corynebacterium imitans]|uniref:ABC transporter substrate-binding protein n=1 Tax=Corynebacterium imitans TaxID=156978 RepID=UPI00254AFABC|nr:ABC transporter substrate-binding protein [Corynebacterium imitans]MDK8306771.1 ABC transporter substrate-binding protein [Corynebacterium imitans]MDK8638249.1 ABC transporter substrate-binding protein [Corynebacterium imitans]MDK8773328.1 ABC transporter substrate-binding protein [Corynebacterium imitans]
MAERTPRALAAVLTASALALAGCSTLGDDNGQLDDQHFGYQVSGPLLTTNAASLQGASTQAQRLSGRLYPGVFVPGPGGEMIPNTDLVKAQALPGAQRRVSYTLSDAAVFSDGTPVTCADYLLTFTAGQLPELFGAHLPLFDDTESLQCAPGAKTFTVVFKEGRGDRWRGLFDAGTVLPAHAVAKKAGMSEEELVDALHSLDPARIAPIAKVWRTGFDFAEFDPELQVSFGPYVIESFGEQGEVNLVANEHYYGDQPQVERLVVWPGSADSAQLYEHDALKVADLDEPDPEWFDVNAENNRIDLTTVHGELTEVLTFPDVGPWAEPAQRKALSRCLDPRAVAQASGELAGVEVPVAPVHVLQQDDPLYGRVIDVATPNLDVDIAAASRISGAQIRMAYPYPNARHAAMVESMRRTCEPAGITIIDVTESGKTLADLPHATLDDQGNPGYSEGNIDVLLRPVDPMKEYPAADNRAANVGALRAQEKALWEQLPSLPLATQPRTFAVHRGVANVVPYAGMNGISWNMDRWRMLAKDDIPPAPDQG